MATSAKSKPVDLGLVHRPRRLRQNPILRSMVEETRLSPKDFIYPMFLCEGRRVREEIPSMPDIYRQSVDQALKEMEEALALGVRSVILFGIPGHKDALGSEAYSEEGIIQKGVRAAKKAFGADLLVVTDVCLCEYTDHGHCAPVKGGVVLNDEGVLIHCRTALSHARAGADVVAPSDMMDGRVGAIRATLDEEGFQSVPIMAYSAKYASAYYGPFRDAANSAPQFGDRRSYQMDPPNAEEAIREVELDLEEGADIVMVKPALPYLDIIRRVRETFPVPLAAYNVSGEYAMVKAAARLGWIDNDRVVMETLTSIRRAGASIILTYHAKEAARLLAKG
ncbi:MAG: porphobilinogen synthase [Acidobacteriota bacterium]